MATVEISSTVEKEGDISKEASDNSRANSAEFNNNIQNGGDAVTISSLQQDTFGVVISEVTAPQVVPAANGVVDKDVVPQNTTNPIPASMFSYRFASPTSNQTPYYVSSDIVLSGGMAQQTRRRIVHNEVERRRKDKINKWILKLAQAVPQCKWGKQSKNIVLEKTVEYINEVNDQLKELGNSQQREQKLAQEVQHLKTRLGKVTTENKVLKDLLKKNNVTIPRNILTMADSTSAMTGLERVNSSVAVTMVNSNSEAVTTATSKTLQVEIPVTVKTTPVVTMVTQLPVATATVAGVQSRKESVAYVAPFFIANNPVSIVTSATCLVTPAVTSAMSVTAPIAHNAGSSQHSHVQGRMSSSVTLSHVNQGICSQLANNLICSSTPQPVQALPVPVCSSQVAPSPQAGFSQHSVAAIMKVALQPGTSVSPVAVVDASSLSTPTVATNATAMFTVQPTAVISEALSTAPQAVLVSAPSLQTTSNSCLNEFPGIANSSTISQAQSSSGVSTFYVATAPNQSVSVAMVIPNHGSLVHAQAKGSNNGGKMPGEKNNKVGNLNRPRAKPKARNNAAKGTSQSKALSENKTAAVTNKRGATHLPATSAATAEKRANNCIPRGTTMNLSICQQTQDEVMAVQTFNVTALIPGIASQGSSSNDDVHNAVSNRFECNKTIAQASSIGAGQVTQVPRLSHSIASLAGLSQGIGQPVPETPTDIQRHQQVSAQLSTGSLSFSAESLLASNEVVLPNIPHISTTTVSESNCGLQSSLAPVSSINNTANDQSHTQSFSNYSAVALIGGNEIIGEPVVAQETHLQRRPSRTTYSDFSAESLIGSNDLNSGLSYAIDKLISSRSDANGIGTAMVSVNPNLLHSVKSNTSYDTGTNSLRALAALPDLVEQKSAASSNQSTTPYLSGTIQNGTYGASSSNSAAMQLSLNNNSDRRLRETSAQQQGAYQTVTSSNNFPPSSSASFLKHSVDSITSSFSSVNNGIASTSIGPISTSNSGGLFQAPMSFAVDPPTMGNQLSFGSMTNPFSPTRSFFNHSSTMGSFV
ncbi:Upstream stimulatory factor 2 [Acropora cervicornis]|uniref:Upstream stimulatory factor 2 n=1 Tax=Acropora cervicornis TaxID=6130 RepID=A0AAD9QSJ7_ACRCE|nr:Upstream stimulatory factor 2 [Acropora cervicornis]